MAAREFDAGTVIGGYQIESILGKGGMGVVYKAHELSLNRKVALKVLSQRLSSDQEFITRFKREARVIAALDHPNIVRILSYGEDEDLYYYAMEFIPGKDLGRILKERSAIPLDEALDITAQVAEALVEADHRGVVHRDLKPANIMIDEKGRVHITDFGVAYFKEADTGLTRTGFFLGTPEFASPEQASGARLDVRSDIYSLGAILYWMLSGKPPFTGDSPQAVLIKIATQPLPAIQTINPSVPEPVCALIEKMTAKDPADRYQKPDDVLTAIGECAVQLVPRTQQTKPGEGKTRRKPVLSDAVTLGVLLGLGLLVILAVWQGGTLYQKLKSGESKQSQKAETATPSVRPSETGGLVGSTISSPDEKNDDGSVGRDKPPLAGQEKTVVEEAAGPPPPGASPVEVPSQPESSRHAAESVTARANPPSGEAEPLNEPAQAGQAEAVPSPPAETAAVREIPNVLIIASGDESLVPLLRTNLAAIILQSGLKLINIAEIPRLRERIQMGQMPITQYSIMEIVPREKADIILLAQIQKTGTTSLQFYGQTQEMTTAAFTVEAIDLAGGNAVNAQAMGTASFSPLNMIENVKTAVQESAGGIGREIKQHWQRKQNGL